MSKKNDNTLVKNASFLMIAALISKIIGLIYKSPLSNTMGKESFGCFQFAQNVYFILLMIASFSIPQAVSKIMAERLAFKRYRDAQRIFKGALLYAVVVGGAISIFCVAGAPILVPRAYVQMQGLLCSFWRLPFFFQEFWVCSEDIFRHIETCCQPLFPRL